MKYTMQVVHERWGILVISVKMDDYVGNKLYFELKGKLLGDNFILL